MSGRPDASQESRSFVRPTRRFIARSASRFFEATGACTTYASYPHVSKVARGSLGGRRMVGNGLDCSEAVHVLFRLPVRPWTCRSQHQDSCATL